MTGELVASVPLAHHANVEQVVVLERGAKIVTGSEDASVRIW